MSRAEATSSVALTPPQADADLRAHITAGMSHAVFPSAQGTYCPIAYIVAQTAQCLVEYHVGSAWSFLGTTLWVRKGAVRIGVERTGPGPFDRAGFYWYGTWRRRWVQCPRPRSWSVQGTLESNNACGNGNYGGIDWALIGELWVNTPRHPNVFTFQSDFYGRLSWTFMDSAGYALGSFYGTRHGGVYTYTNVVGDSFRYTP